MIQGTPANSELELIRDINNRLEANLSRAASAMQLIYIYYT